MSLCSQSPALVSGSHWSAFYEDVSFLSRVVLVSFTVPKIELEIVSLLSLYRVSIDIASVYFGSYYFSIVCEMIVTKKPQAYYTLGTIGLCK